MSSIEKPAAREPAAAPAPQTKVNGAVNTVALPSRDRGASVGAKVLSVRPNPTSLACLHCQLIGKRRLMCAKADVCADLPISFAMGPLLLAAWFITTVAFILAVL